MAKYSKEDLKRLAQISMDTLEDPKLFGLNIDLTEVAVQRLDREKNPAKIIRRKSDLQRKLSRMRSRINKRILAYGEAN